MPEKDTTTWTAANTGTVALTALFNNSLPAASNGGALCGVELAISGKMCAGIANAGGSSFANMIRRLQSYRVQTSYYPVNINCFK